MNKDNKHLAVIFSDWHIHDYKRFNTDGQRLDNCIKVLFDIGDFCKKHNIKTILFAGDLYDVQKSLYTKVVNDTVAAFKRFEKHYSSINIYAITGNHDQSTKNLIDKEAVSALEHIQTVCGNFTVIDNDAVNVGDNVIVHGVPYYEYPEHFEIRLKEASISAQSYEEEGSAVKQYLMIHQTPEGLGNDMIPTDTNPKDPAYKIFDHTFCGHIHIHKKITEDFTLVGNPIHRDLADAGSKKGFLVMNLLAPENGTRFIQLKGYPEFIRAYEDEELSEELEQNYVVRMPRMDERALQSEANVEDFNTSVDAKDLVTNFWQEVDGKDKELLQVGLSFLPITNTTEEEE